jgi:hypothetical protein
MHVKGYLRICIIGILIIITAGYSSAPAVAQDGKRRPTGTPVLWREHRNPASLDLFWGQGGRAMRPDLRRLTFIEEEKGGYSTKYRVRDASDHVWVVKVGKEAQSETAATRLLWAAGYMTEVVYLVPSATIPGKGTFRNVRFEGRPETVEREGEWKWDDNPFKGTREFQGLKVMMVILNNWDIKDSNNVLLATQGREGMELRYAISDLGATLGDTGKWPLLWRFTRSRNDPVGFSGDKIIDEVKEDGRVDFEFSGKKRGMFNDITVEQARWAGRLLSRLTNRQLRDAFRAANYTSQEAQTMVTSIRARVNQLVRLRRPTVR